MPVSTRNGATRPMLYASSTTLRRGAIPRRVRRLKPTTARALRWTRRQACARSWRTATAASVPFMPRREGTGLLRTVCRHHALPCHGHDLLAAAGRSGIGGGGGPCGIIMHPTTMLLRALRSRRRGGRRSAHNVVLPGPPGAGTSMLARCLTTILPAMTLAEAIETTRIHRVAGRIGERTALIARAPEGPAPLSPPPHRLPRIPLLLGSMSVTSGTYRALRVGSLERDYLKRSMRAWHYMGRAAGYEAATIGLPRPGSND
jgi:hypothetical protein